ncbi:MAG: hypothetical protein CSA66_03085 [Proteobacteria bacterium]|nr:MAG: hypothetical protein CSA66_03085 [Pseudomonadota bacterium]
MHAARPLAKTLGETSRIQGITFAAGTDVFFGLDDRLTACAIPEDQVILGVPCAKGLVHFHPDGRLARATLAAAHQTRGARFEPGTRLSWLEDGTLAAHLAGPQRVGEVELPAAVSALLCPEGALIRWSRQVESEQSLGAVPCAAHSKVTLFADGRLMRATAARDAVIDGVTIMGGTDVELHAGGGPAVVTLGAPLSRGGFTFEAGTTVVFRSDGTLSVAHLADDLSHDGRRFEADTYLQFDADERLDSHVSIGWSIAERARG